MNKKLFYAILLIVLTVGIRVIYANYHPEPILSYDGVGYYSLGNSMFKYPGISMVVNQYRTPLYPLLISGVMSLNGHAFTSIHSPEFYESARWIVLIQSIGSISAIIIMYVMLLNMSVPVLWAFGISVFVGCNIALFSWEWVIGTDSLAISVLIWITYTVWRLLRKPTIRWYIILFFLSTAGWLLRPNMLAVSCIAFVVLLFSRENRKKIFLNILVFVVTLLVPYLYTRVNVQYRGYHGISQIIEINLLGQILALDLPVEAGRNSPFYQEVLDYRTTTMERMPYRFLDAYSPAIYGNVEEINKLGEFDRNVIRSVMPMFIMRSLSHIPDIFSDICQIIPVNPQSIVKLPLFFSWLQTFYRIAWYSGYLVFAWFPLSVWMYVRKRTPMNLMFVFLGLVTISEILTIVFLVYHDALQEYARLVTIVQPQAYLLVFLNIYMFVQKLRHKRVGGWTK